MEAYGVHELSIDVRRFTSFGVIKVDLGTNSIFHCDINISVRGFSVEYTVGQYFSLKILLQRRQRRHHH